MTREEILNSFVSKTTKMRMLFELGLSRREVAEAVGVGYGFAQNVYAKCYPDRIGRRRTLIEIIEESEWSLTDFVFNHTFGVEIEAYGVIVSELKEELTRAGIIVQNESYNHETREHWKITSDSSISGQHPFELVSPKLQGEEGLRQLKTVTLILRGLEAKVNKSCGLHIHLDARDFSFQTWKNIYFNYAKIENLIDSFMPSSRRGNQNYYCRTLRSIDFENAITEASDLGTMERSLTNLRDRLGYDRKRKVNSMAYSRHRSIEFRQHSATISYKKISNWILFLARLVEFSKQDTISNESWESMKRFLPENLIQYFAERREELAQ